MFCPLPNYTNVLSDSNTIPHKVAPRIARTAVTMNATSLLIQVFDPRVLRREVQCRHAGSLYPARGLNARTYISGKLPMSDTNCIQWYRYRESIHPRDRMYTCSTLDQPDFEARENAALAKKQNPELAIHQARTTRYIRSIYQVKLQLLFGLLHRCSTVHATYRDNDGL